MTRTILFSLCMCLCLRWPLECQTPTVPAAPAAPPTLPTLPPINMPANTPSTIHIDDDKFLKEAAAGSMAEMELGKLAAQKSSREDVKKFGQKMVDDHTKLDGDLKQVAEKKSLQLPETLDAKEKARIGKLAQLSGRNFDKAFIKDALKDHEADVKEFSDEAQYGSDANVMGFASTTLPVLKQHLDLVKGLSKPAKKAKK